MQRLDGLETENYVKALIYGPSGTGKTGIGVSSEEPLIVLSERQGMVHVREAAARLKKPVPSVIFVEDLVDVLDIYRALKTGDPSKPLKIKHRFDLGEGKVEERVVAEFDSFPKTAVLDSMTDIAQLLVESVDQQSPPKLGKDGVPVRSQGAWGLLESRFRNFMRSWRDLPMNVLFLALLDDRTVGEGEDSVRSFGPELPMRKFPQRLCASVNMVGVSYRRTKREMVDGKLRSKLFYGVQTVGPEYMLTKPYRPLRDVEVPDFSYWCKVIRGSQNLQEAPPPMTEMDGGETTTEAPTEAPTVTEAVEKQQKKSSETQPKRSKKSEK